MNGNNCIDPNEIKSIAYDTIMGEMPEFDTDDEEDYDRAYIQIVYGIRAMTHAFIERYGRYNNSLT
jgi:hypothetical protein